uniref:ATP synthase complex subunit 8 n=1 Tax=Staphylinoidea sp. 13 KM-2017 TaxID=2219453 RepID=A0A346RI46_9COLE|nr:ATP synthase F0 subunit 8 [Staphylinoidea sp. 13 KM-2017]
MPQMAPLNWLILFIYFSFIFILLNSLNYFSFLYKIKNNFSNKIIKKNSWKW